MVAEAGERAKGEVAGLAAGLAAQHLLPKRPGLTAVPQKPARGRNPPSYRPYTLLRKGRDERAALALCAIHPCFGIASNGGQSGPPLTTMRWRLQPIRPVRRHYRLNGG